MCIDRAKPPTPPSPEAVSVHKKGPHITYSPSRRRADALCRGPAARLMNFYPQYNEPVQPGYHQLGAEDYVLTVRQQPRDGLVAQEGKEKSRKPIDPPPFVELTVRDGADPRSGFLVDPYLFVCASLLPADATKDELTSEFDEALAGSIVSSLHKLKDVDSKDGGFFVFGDLSAKRIGEYKLMFSLFELQKASHEVVFLRSVLSDTFTGMHECSTNLRSC